MSEAQYCICIWGGGGGPNCAQICVLKKWDMGSFSLPQKGSEMIEEFTQNLGAFLLRHSIRVRIAYYYRLKR